MFACLIVGVIICTGRANSNEFAVLILLSRHLEEEDYRASLQTLCRDAAVKYLPPRQGHPSDGRLHAVLQSFRLGLMGAACRARNSLAASKRCIFRGTCGRSSSAGASPCPCCTGRSRTWRRGWRCSSPRGSAIWRRLEPNASASRHHGQAADGGACDASDLHGASSRTRQHGDAQSTRRLPLGAHNRHGDA